MHKQLSYRRILATRDMSEQYDFTEREWPLRAVRKASEIRWCLYSVLKVERPLLGCTGFLSYQGFDRGSHLWLCLWHLVSVYPFYLPSPRSCFLLPSSSQTWPLHSENQIQILDTCISGFNDFFLFCCTSVNGSLTSAQTSAMRVFINWARIFFRKWMWVCSKSNEGLVFTRGEQSSYCYYTAMSLES